MNVSLRMVIFFMGLAMIGLAGPVYSHGLFILTQIGPQKGEKEEQDSAKARKRMQSALSWTSVFLLAGGIILAVISVWG